MTILILAEHDGQQLSPAVRQAVTAAQFWNAPVHVLVAGSGSSGIAQQAAAITGVERVIHAEASHLTHPLAEDVANSIIYIGNEYQVILAAHSSFSRCDVVLPPIKIDLPSSALGKTNAAPRTSPSSSRGHR